MKFGPQRGRMFAMNRTGRQQSCDQPGGSESAGTDSTEGPTPAESVADSRARRNAQHVGDGYASQEHGHRHASLLRRNEIHRRNASRPKEQAVTARAKDATRHQPGI